MLPYLPAQGEADDELSFPKGAMIKVVGKEADGWWEGEYDGTTGYFPAVFIMSCSDNAAAKAWGDGKLDVLETNVTKCPLPLSTACCCIISRNIFHHCILDLYPCPHHLQRLHQPQRPHHLQRPA